MIKKIIYTLMLIVILFFSAHMNCTKIYAADTVDSVVEGAGDFLKAGSQSVVDTTKLHSTSNFIFELLFGIALVVAVIIGMIIGIRFMMAGIEEKAKIKEELLPYFVGCVIVFGAFGIWKLAVTVLSKL